MPHTAAHDPPQLSVIIPTYQRRSLVLATLESLKRQEFAPPFEVIVVVDGSQDGTTESLRALDGLPFQLTVLEQAMNLGQARARNRGAAAARGEILLFLDDDMDADPRLLSEHDRTHRRGAQVVLGHIAMHSESVATAFSDRLAKYLETLTSRLAAPGESPSYEDFCSGQMSVRRDLFEAFGGFDEHFTRGGAYGNEDLEFGYRVISAGTRIAFNPDAITHQRYTIDAATEFLRVRQQGQADVVLVRMHPELAEEVFTRRLAESEIFRLTQLLARAAPRLARLLTAPLRLLVTRRAARNQPGALEGRLFFAMRAVEYWRGVYDAGGIPRQKGR